MKINLSFQWLLIFISLIPLVASSSDKLSYQAVIRDQTGLLIKNQQITLEINIIKDNANGTIVYSEILKPFTNINGLVSIEFGGEDLLSIDWQNGPYYLKTLIDPTGGNNLSIVSTNQILTVPYAIHAQTAERLINDIEEEDPWYFASVASSINEQNVESWNTASEYISVLKERLRYLESLLDIDISNLIPTITLDEIIVSGANSIVAKTTASVPEHVAIRSRGLIWGLTTNPTVELNDGILLTSSEAGQFETIVTSLSRSTTYYVRAFASSFAGIAYSEEMMITTLDVILDSENNTYDFFAWEGKLWMSENLRTLHYNDGSPILGNLADWEWSTVNEGAYAIPPHDYIEGINTKEEMVQLYGVLYNFQAVNDPRGICPVGWRLPTDDEWIELEISLGMDLSDAEMSGWRGQDQSGKLKSTRTAPESHPRWNYPNNPASNAIGYNAVPTGYRSNNGPFYTFGEHGLWWTSTTNTDIAAYYRTIKNDHGKIGRFFAYNNYGFAVRCVKDIED